MSDNPMCEVCPLRRDAKACLETDCRAYSIITYCGIPAICFDLKCWEVKTCSFSQNISNCPKLADWKKTNPEMCEYCGAICGHHWDECPNDKRAKQ